MPKFLNKFILKAVFIGLYKFFVFNFKVHNFTFTVVFILKNIYTRINVDNFLKFLGFL